jgi:hypothetical protein
MYGTILVQTLYSTQKYYLEYRRLFLRVTLEELFQSDDGPSSLARKLLHLKDY